jgi:signal transduction histidine kinase
MRHAIHVEARSRLLLLLAIPIVVGVFTWSVAREGRRQSIGLRHALRVELLLERLMSHLKEAETSQRGYLLTGEARFLEPYHAATVEARRDLAALSSLTIRQQRAVEQMRPLVDAKLAQLEKTLELYRTRAFSPETAKIAIDRGKDRMDSIWLLGDEMRHLEEGVLHERELAWSRISTFFFWSLALGYAVIVLTVASLYRRVRRYGQQSAEAEERLSRLNAELDQRVRERTALLEDREQQLRALAGNLLTAQEHERRRVARELHDDVTQRLAFLSIELGNLAGEIPNSLSETRHRVRALQDQTLRVSNEVRRVSHGLHPSVITDFGLGIALEEFCQEFEKAQGTHVQFEGLVEDSQLDAAGATCLYRIAQESMRNAVIHGHATEICVELTVGCASMQLRVRDNGVGLSTDGGRPKTGLGVISMRERIRLMNGALELSSQAGHGTEVIASVPLAGVHNGTASHFAG